MPWQTRSQMFDFEFCLPNGVRIEQQVMEQVPDRFVSGGGPKLVLDEPFRERCRDLEFPPAVPGWLFDKISLS